MPIIEQIVLGAGCFWCTEAAFQELQGVVKVEPGYSGGHTENPAYEEVCSGKTGHAEVAKITFDTDTLSLDDLLDVFFSIHDPTTLNRQGADVGEQYRSVIFPNSEEQRITSEQKIRQLENDKVYPEAIVTKIEPFSVFYPAEEYHKNYYRNNESAPYCRAVISPKIAKLRKLHLDLLKP